MCSIPSSLLSSTNMPLPWTSRVSSRRRIGWPTHFMGAAWAVGVRVELFFPAALRVAGFRAADFFVGPFFFTPSSPVARGVSVARSCERCLQRVDQFLQVLASQRFE